MVVAFTALVVLSRLPQILDPDQVLDLDEAVVGIMARHLAAGETFPVFFYGQNYGLTLLEAASAAVCFAVAGPSAAALKVAMLPFWILSGVFLLLACRRIAGARAGWMAVFFLASCPTWVTWSLKARGGYATAFLFTSLVLWLLARRHTTVGRARATWAAGILGGAMALAVFAQPTCLPALAPFVVLGLLVRPPGRAEWLGLLGGIAVVSGPLLAVIVSNPPPIWSPPGLEFETVEASLTAIPRAVFTVLTGRFVLGVAHAAGPLTRVAAALWTIALVYALVRSLVGIRDVARLRPAILAGLLVSLGAYSQLRVGMEPYRYLVPLAYVLVIFLALELARPGRWRTVAAVVLLLVGLGSAAEPPWAGPQHAEDSKRGRLSGALDELAGWLDERDVRHVYCLTPWTEFVLQFWTDEKILVRCLGARSRIPGRTVAVDRARASGAPTAVMWPCGALPFVASRVKVDHYPLLGRIEKVGGLWIVLREPPPDLLQSLGFKPGRR